MHQISGPNIMLAIQLILFETFWPTDDKFII